MLPVDYGYLHNSIYIVIWAVISVFRAGFGRFRPVSLGFVKKTHPLNVSAETLRWIETFRIIRGQFN